MKITSKQLRKIVNEEVTRLHEEDMSDDAVVTYNGSWLAKSVADSLFENRPSIAVSALSAYEQEMGEDIAVPARIEDVEAYAVKVADVVLADQGVREEVEFIARRMLRNAMKPVAARMPGAIGAQTRLVKNTRPGAG
jgi:hypothetical protein